MANAKTGLWSAFGALLGGVAGAAAGHYAATMRPRVRAELGIGGADIEDAMVIGGATGAVLGAFIGGAAGGESAPAAAALPSNPQQGQLYSYAGPDGTPHTAQWNGTAWIGT